jgi:hypothetical protein
MSAQEYAQFEVEFDFNQPMFQLKIY